ncbi:hypothetical protein [Microbulbifer pacificus]|uniref:Uncharacterized protein n=1 Tax=Microbulbifer pacificus TaxID=407164 RepID=A0AAU0MXZ1_9GAMM|nr:hypothetical protein [Microbulbifer pacificus]WOX05070.1 hypothetical protein R5R33_15175 [Microbulbifer pacificus]
MKNIVALFLIFIASIASVFIVQMMITKLWNFSGVTWGPGDLPVSPVQQIAMLTTTFIAGLFAPIVAIAICRRIPWVVIFAICTFGLTIDVFAVLVPLVSLPLWFKVSFVISVPLQVYVGTKIGTALFLSRQPVVRYS